MINHTYPVLSPISDWMWKVRITFILKHLPISDFVTEQNSLNLSADWSAGSLCQSNGKDLGYNCRPDNIKLGTRPTLQIRLQNLIPRNYISDHLIQKIWSSQPWGNPFYWCEMASCTLNKFWKLSRCLIQVFCITNLTSSPASLRKDRSDHIASDRKGDVQLRAENRFAPVWYGYMSLSMGFDGLRSSARGGTDQFHPWLFGSIPLLTQLAMTLQDKESRNLIFESTLGSIGLRGRSSLQSFPYESYKTHEYVPLSEIRFVIGIDWMSGNWRLQENIREKWSRLRSCLGWAIHKGWADLNELAIADADPDFILEDYGPSTGWCVQPGLQLPAWKIAIILRSKDWNWPVLMASWLLQFSQLYNFHLPWFPLMPEIKYKPADGLTK